jgi:hypothetical protein
VKLILALVLLVIPSCSHASFYKERSDGDLLAYEVWQQMFLEQIELEIRLGWLDENGDE